MWVRSKDTLNKVPRGRRGCSAGFPQGRLWHEKAGPEMVEGPGLLELVPSARQDHEQEAERGVCAPVPFWPP